MKWKTVLIEIGWKMYDRKIANITFPIVNINEKEGIVIPLLNGVAL